jgi:hypothetical protein
MGMITIGGLLTSSFLTLIVVPVIYSLLDRAQVRVLEFGRRLLPSRLRPGAEAKTG